MSAIAIVSLLAGAVLGRSLKVLVLIPAIAAGILVVFAVAVPTGASVGWTVWSCTVVAVGLQFGYLAGGVTDALLTATRAPRSGAAAQPVGRTRSVING